MKSLPSSHSHGSNLLSYLQMIESSDHGDEYDGVIFSQLVRWFFLSVKTAYLFQLYGLSQQLFSISSFPFFVLFWFQNLIDLAGSESSKTETTGLRRKEGSYINKSLLTLGTVCKQKYLILLLWWNFLLLIFLYWSPMTLFLK